MSLTDTALEEEERNMDQIEGASSASGVFIAKDFRDNLIIDRYDPCFRSMRASKKKHLRSQNSEDVVSWNVFRSLRQISPPAWIPPLLERAFPGQELTMLPEASVDLWRSISPPPALLESGDEGISEIDIVIESSNWVWFIEAKLTSDISTGTVTRPDRDQVLRNIDVGSYYAGTRQFLLTLLIQDPATSPKGIGMVDQYRDLGVARKKLPHRVDGLANLIGVGLLYWSDLIGVLHEARSRTLRNDEAVFAERAIKWLQSHHIIGVRT
jgi:hypothetical protein